VALKGDQAEPHIVAIALIKSEHRERDAMVLRLGQEGYSGAVSGMRQWR
jgi:hypothetical protein